MVDTERAERLRALGNLVRDARAAKGLDIVPAVNAAKAAGSKFSRATWYRVEEGRPGLRDTTYAAVERVLDWAPGSIRRYLAGGPEPTTASRPTKESILIEVGDLSEAERDTLRQLAERFREAKRP